jgi:hypothetical protein
MLPIRRSCSRGMAAGQLRNLDLNLLLALDALLTERNVTRAAERVRLTEWHMFVASGMGVACYA